MTTPVASARTQSGRPDRALSEPARPPGRYEGEWALLVIMHLKHNELPLGEQAMMRVERPDLATKADRADIPVPTVTITRACLRGQLEKAARLED